jgi:hypothetical protein
MQAEPEGPSEADSGPGRVRSGCVAHTGGIRAREFLKFLHRSGVVFYQRRGLRGSGGRSIRPWAWMPSTPCSCAAIAPAGCDRGGRRPVHPDPRLINTSGAEIRRTEKKNRTRSRTSETFLGLMEQCHICFRVRRCRVSGRIPSTSRRSCCRPGDYRRGSAASWRSAPRPGGHAPVRLPPRWGDPHVPGADRGSAKEHAEYWKFGCWFYDREPPTARP